MATISKDEVKFVQSYPLAATLDPLRSSFQLRDDETTSTSSDEITDLSVTRDAISKLLVMLQIHAVAQKLKSSSRRPVDAELGTLYGRVRSGDFDLGPFEPLTTAVASNASDLEVWTAVLHLINTLSRVTPPPSRSILPSFNGTPISRSSASHQGTDQTRRDLRPIIREELNGKTFMNTDGFWMKYFEGKRWNPRCDSIYNSLSEKHNKDVLRDYPVEHVEEKIWKWLQQFQKECLAQPQEDSSSSPGGSTDLPAIPDPAPGKYFRTTTAHEFVDGQSKRQLDVFLKHSSVSANKTHSWRDVLVIGELTKSSQKNTASEKFLQLAVYVREVFAAQPLRRFVHGFLMFADEIQLWVFDRSGAYSCDAVNIREQPERFIRAIAGYALMSDEELGLDTFVQRDGQHTTILVNDSKTSKDRVMEIASQPFTIQRSIVSRGTACYRTTDGKHVVKFSWRDADRRAEPELLKAASSVAGLAKLVGSRELSSTKKLRNGLDFSPSKGVKPKIFRPANAERLGSANLSFSSNPAELVTMTISGSKRSQDFAADEEETRTSKKVRSTSLPQEIAQSDVTKSPTQFVKPQAPFRNRILTCLAISPAGRPLRDFKSVQEFLTGMRDAIQGHKALFIDGRILHRDISENNIILTDTEKNNGFTGMLIDLDMAVKVGDDGKNEQTGARQRTGTLDFMALEILKNWLNENTAGIEHTYRHDLESFFYVFLTVCIRYGWEDRKPPSIDPLSTWYTGNRKNIHRSKAGDMGFAFETAILSEFSPTFTSLTGLARKLREILFSKGALFTGTPENPEELYVPLIEAFDGAIQALKW